MHNKRFYIFVHKNATKGEAQDKKKRKDKVQQDQERRVKRSKS